MNQREKDNLIRIAESQRAVSASGRERTELFLNATRELSVAGSPIRLVQETGRGSGISVPNSIRLERAKDDDGDGEEDEPETPPSSMRDKRIMAKAILAFVSGFTLVPLYMIGLKELIATVGVVAASTTPPAVAFYIVFGISYLLWQAINSVLKDSKPRRKRTKPKASAKTGRKK